MLNFQFYIRKRLSFGNRYLDPFSSLCTFNFVIRMYKQQREEKFEEQKKNYQKWAEFFTEILVFPMKIFG